jgi:hypothetical protein
VSGGQFNRGGGKYRQTNFVFGSNIFFRADVWPVANINLAAGTGTPVISQVRFEQLQVNAADTLIIPRSENNIYESRFNLLVRDSNQMTQPSVATAIAGSCGATTCNVFKRFITVSFQLDEDVMNVTSPDNPQIVSVQIFMSVSYQNILGTHPVVLTANIPRYELENDIQNAEVGIGTQFILSPSSSPEPSTASASILPTVIGVAAGCLALVIVAGFLGYLWHRRATKKLIQSFSQAPSVQELQKMQTASTLTPPPAATPATV